MNSYDLVLQPVFGGSTNQQPTFEEAFAKRGLRPTEEDAWSWQFSATTVSFSPLTKAQPAVAYEVRVPLSTSPRVMFDVLGELIAFAEQHAMQLTDVHLTRAVTRGDFSAVVKSFVAVAAYRGFAPEPQNDTERPPPSRLLSWPMVTALAVLVFFATLYFSYQMVSG